MSVDTPSVQTFKETLSLQDDELDEELGIALTNLVQAALHDKEPQHHLSAITEAVRQSGCASALEPLTIVPMVVRSDEEGADGLMELMAIECSAKEVVMAVEEGIETLERQLQGEDEIEEDTQHVSPARQLIRLIHTYSITIPRLPQWKKSPAETLESRIVELVSVISLLTRDFTSEEGRSLISTVSRLSLTLKDEADVKTKDLLLHLIEETVLKFATHLDGGLARKAFATHFSRLVVPRSDPSSSTDSRGDNLTDAWSALNSLGFTTQFYEGHPSLPALILLAHHPAYPFSLQTLVSFFPIVLSSIQSNVALDEVLSILLSSLAPLHSANPRSELNTDLIVPLIHLLPHLASNHFEADIRHYTFRIMSLVLGLSPSPLRFRLLQELFRDEDLPPQMRVAAVGLLKEAVLEGITAKDQNIFVSPHLLQTFGPIVLRPDPPDLSMKLHDFLDSAEPLRLVECLGFYYVLLRRDVQNRTGVRDGDSLWNVQHALLRPIRARMKSWKEVDTDPEEHGHHSAMRLGILDMWLERVQGAIDAVSSLR